MSVFYLLIVLQFQSEFILRIDQQKMFPFIFTISILFIIIAFLTSKLQNESTNLLISIYSALGSAQTAAITLTTIVFINNGHEETIIKILLFASLGIIFLVNLMGYIVQTPFLLKDRRFLKWANRISRRQQSRSNLICFHIISLLSFFTSYKLKMILFSRLFNFECFKFQLQSISKFKVFNVLSFIGFFPQILSLYCCISVIAYSTLTMEQLIIFIDLLIIIVLNMIFSLVIIKKDENFFTETSGGLPMNKIFNLIEEMSSSSHIINQRQRQGQQKKRVQLEDISEFDEYAYTSTKRERNVKLVGLKNKGEKEQDSYYFQETQSENTGSKINSEISNEQMQVVNTSIPQNQNQHKKMQQNILNIDDFYQDQSNDGVKQRQQQMLNEPINHQQPLSLDQTPYITQKIHRNSSKHIKNSKNPKDTHTKLSDYLLSIQRYHEQKIKDNSEDTDCKIIDKQIDSGAETQRNKQKFLILINQSALIDSQSSVIPNNLTPHRYEIFCQQTIDHEEQQAAKKIIQKVVSAHNSPKKIIQVEQDKKPQKINLLSSSININDQHDQRPIKNKSIEKAKKQENHPINTPINTHPIYGQKASKQSQDDESDITQLKDRRVKVQQQKTIPVNIQTMQAPLQQAQLKINQQMEPQVPRLKFYQQFIQQEEQSNNSFKQTHPQSLALFSKKNKHKSMIVDNAIGNTIPRKPMQYSYNQFQGNSDKNNESQFVLKRNFDRAIKLSTNKPRERPMTSKQGRFHKFSLQKKSIKCLQGKKMLSLEKIYLQRLSNF